MHRWADSALYLSEDAVDGTLVHFAGDSIFAKTCGHCAQIIQRGHSQSHFRLLITELVNLPRENRTVFKRCNWTNCNHQSRSHSTSEISIWNSPAAFPEGLAAALQPANQVCSPWTIDPEQSSQRVACSRPHLAYYHTLNKKKTNEALNPFFCISVRSSIM